MHNMLGIIIQYHIFMVIRDTQNALYQWFLLFCCFSNGMLCLVHEFILELCNNLDNKIISKH